MTYQAYSCKDCHEPLYWNPNVVSQKTGKKIPLNSDGNYHYTTCAAASTGTTAAAAPQQPQQTEQVPSLTKDPIPASGPRDWEEKLGLLNGQVFARLDRIDQSIKQIARAIDGINSYFHSLPPIDQEEERKATTEFHYGQDKEDGLI